MKELALFVFLGALFNYSFAQNPSLVADVNTTTDQEIDFSGDFIYFNDAVYFNGEDNNGLYLWKTDGTTDHTLKVAKPGLFISGYGAHPFPGIINDGLLYYRSAVNSDDEDQNKLFVTNGTQSGTFKVTDKVLNPYEFIVMDDIVYFEGTDPDSVHYDLWRSDGTDSGTSKVFDYTQDSFHYFGISGATVAGGKLFFALADWLYVTDGTEAGTTFVLETGEPGGGATPITKMVSYQDKAWFFTAGTDEYGLWYSDGTASGTQILHAFDYNFHHNMNLLNGKLIMVADDGVHGVELWVSDGTVAGTIMVKDINPGINDGLDFESGYFGITIIDNEAYFFANDGVHGNELWKSDGTAAGTTMIKDILPGPDGSYPIFFRKLNDKVAFIAADSAVFGFDEGLFITDGTDAGTYEVASLPTFGVNQMVSSGDKVFFIDQNDEKVWVSDGTAAGTNVIPVNLNQNQSSYPHQMVKLQEGKYLFNASYGNTMKDELWVTDGTPAGSEYLMTNPSGYALFDLCPSTLNSSGFFAAVTGSGSSDMALWKSDGTLAGTFKLKDIEPDFSRGTVVLNNALYFAAAPDKLWRTDGTGTGTYKVADIHVDYLTLYNGEIYFNSGGSGDKELWKSDGTAAGTQLVADINPAGSSKPSYITAANGKLFFSATTDPEGEEPWVSDGTSGGTYLLKNIFSGNNKSSYPTHFTASGSYVYFSAKDQNHGIELWRTDGTTAGTQLVKDIAPGITDFSPNLLTDLNGTLFFTSAATNSAGSVWRTNGDETSTTIQLQEGDEYISQLKNINNLVYAVRKNYEQPDELWRMDTTFCHHVKLHFFQEVMDEDYELLLTDSNIEFMAMKGETTGQELWRYTTQPISAVEICNSIDDDCNGIVDDNIIFPIPSITFDGYQLCSDPFTSYHWYLDGAPVNGATTQCYVPIISGAYSVQVTDSTDCDGWSEDFPVLVSGIAAYYSQKLLLYPNPASTYIMVQGIDQLFSQDQKLVITDILGREIFMKEISSSPLRIDVSDWMNGLYFICSVSSGGIHFQTKFMKQ
jgi:ELWxxDGT repeat protein